MPFSQVGSIKYYQFSSLESTGIYHAVFTRHGGFSPSPWHSMNFGGTVGDDPERVRQNRETALKVLDISPGSVYDLYQVHSSTIVTTNRPLARGEAHIKADAILTNQPNITLMMRFADCVPILLSDPIHAAIGIAHAGWIGTVEKLAGKVMHKMIEQFGTEPKDVIAAIGPSIGPEHYSIGENVAVRVRQSFGKKSEYCLSMHNGRVFFDLWTANQMLLEESGVRHIEVCNICTACNMEDWYSHRGEHGRTGRFGVVFGLHD